MARALKTMGLEELNKLRSRARRQHALGRITRRDCEWIVERLDEVEAYITKMNERGAEQELG